MMILVRYFFSFIVLLICTVSSARGQYLGIGGGGVFSQDLKQESQAIGMVSPGPSQTPASASAERSDFSTAGLLTIEAGTSLLPFVTGGLHYSYSRPDLSLRRGDAFGSSAFVETSAHTLTFDARLRTPHFAGYRLYGLLGAGFSRFALDVRDEVETPFPGGAPENVISPVFTYGAGVERSVTPLVHLKLEVRDYLTGVSEHFFRPEGAWHRIAVTVGIVLGR